MFCSVKLQPNGNLADVLMTTHLSVGCQNRCALDGLLITLRSNLQTSRRSGVVGKMELFLATVSHVMLLFITKRHNEVRDVIGDRSSVV